MNRADFLKRLGLGAIGIAVAPKVISENDLDNQENKYKIRYLDPPNIAFKYREQPPETDTNYDCYTSEPYDCIMSEDFIKADRAWHDHVLDEVFLGKTMG